MSSPQPPPQPDHQAAQAGLAVAIGLAIEQLWPHLDLLNLKRSLPAFIAAVAQQVQSHAMASATLATRQYTQQRVAAGAGRGFTPRPADPPPLAQVAAAVNWSVEPLFSSNVQAFVSGQPEAAPTETLPSAGSAIADAKARLAAASERQVLDAGRETITANAAQDRKARGWVRIAEPDACYFCALLATRTPGFGSFYQDGSFERSDAKFVNHKDIPSDVKTHDHCRCHVEPVFGAYEPTAEVRRWQQMYADVKPDPADGPPSKAQQIAWRRAYEGRTAPAK